jgi:outer membrane protein TolC
LFEKPFGNNAARGLVLQQDATLSQRSISAADLERVIKANVVQLTRSLAETADQVARAQEATTLYARTVADENERFQGGQSTLIDTITTRQLGTSAALAYSAARQQWATLLALLRYETGTLVDVTGGKNVVRQESLLNLPGAGPAK